MSNGVGGGGRADPTRTKEGAKAVMAERNLARDRYQARRQRDREFFAAVRRRIRRLFSRS